MLNSKTRVDLVLFATAFTLTGTLGIATGEVADLKGFGFPVTDGFQPRGSVSYHGGYLYGTTMGGGTTGRGVLFALKTNGTDFRVLHTFTGINGDGQSPQSEPVVGRDKYLYGTTPGGGAHGAGVLYRCGLEGKEYAVLHAFRGAEQGREPRARPIEGRDGRLYGTAALGGPKGGGTIYRIETNGNKFAVLYAFGTGGQDGATPVAELLEGPEGALYGTTSGGGNAASGTVFVLNTDGSGYRVLHRFSAGGTEGRSPGGALYEHEGALYGMTLLGGAHGGGTVYRVPRDGSGLKVIHNFDTRGRPAGALVRGRDEAFYGVTQQGGLYAGGTIFRLTSDGAFGIVHDFGWQGLILDAARGREPVAGLVLGGDGVFYGTTSAGGPYRLGTVYRFD